MGIYRNYEMGKVERLLKAGEQGAVVADHLTGKLSRNRQVLDKFEVISSFAGLTSMLFVDRHEYLDVQHPGPVRFGPGRAKISAWGESGKVQVRNPKPVGDVDLSEAAYAAWTAHDEVEPGGWTLWHDTSFDPIPVGARASGIGFKVTLQEALLIPHQASELEDVRSFKRNNADELAALRKYLAELYMKVAQVGFDAGAIRIEANNLHEAIKIHTDKARKWNRRLSVGDLVLKMNFAPALIEAFKGAVSAGAASLLTSGFASVAAGAAMGAGTGLVQGVAIEGEYGLKRKRVEPFAYLSRFVREYGGS